MSDINDRFDLLELDDGPRRVATDDELARVDLDMVDAPHGETRCVSCKGLAPVNDAGVCRACYEDTAPQRAASAAIDAFSAIADQSRANANAFGLGTVANGRATLGVGFSNAEGYIEALRRGVAPATLREYTDILKRQYKRKVKVRESNTGSTYTCTIDDETFNAPYLISAGTATAEEQRDKGTNDEAIRLMKERTAARKAAEAKAKAEQSKPAQVVAPEVVEQTAPTRLTHGQLVAGAIAEGYGILVGWMGAGEMTRAEKLERIARAGLPKEWAFDAKDPGVQLTRAVKAAAGQAYNCEQEKKRDQQVVEAREHASRWFMVSRTADDARVGAKFGDIALVVTLYTDKPEPELVFDEQSNADLVAAVRKEFTDRIGAERYIASDISRWLWTTMKQHCGAVKYGGNWYVPRKHRDTAIALVEAFKTWGENWMDPPLPIATTSQLAQGLANGLRAEVDEELRKLEHQRKLVREKTNDPKADVGERAATNFMQRFRVIGERVCAYEAILGADMVATCREKVRVAMMELNELLDGGIVERFANIWDEIKLDIERNGGVLS